MTQGHNIMLLGYTLQTIIIKI